MNQDSLWDKIIGLILLVMLTVPVSALMESATAFQIWEWLVKEQYGTGPSYGSWFGLASIFGLFTFSFTKEKDNLDSVIGAAIFNVVKVFAICCMMLLMVFIAKSMFGW